MVWDECKDLASLGRYIAGDGKTYQVAPNFQMEVRYFALGSALTYTGFEGHWIISSRGALKVDGEDIHHMVMHVTEEIFYREEKLISRDDEDGVIAHYDNVRLSCPIEDKHCVAGDVTYVLAHPLKNALSVISCPKF